MSWPYDKNLSKVMWSVGYLGADLSRRRSDFHLRMGSDRAEQAIAGEVVNLRIEVIATKAQESP
jgi:hypothetical protein